MMKNLKKYIWVIFPIVIFLISLAWVTKTMDEPKRISSQTQVVRRDIRQMVRGVGFLEANEVHPILAEFAGKLKKISVEAGQTVPKKQLLFEVENKEFEQDYRLARAQYRQAKYELKKLLSKPDETAAAEAKESYHKSERLYRDLSKELKDQLELFEKGFVSKKEIEELQGRVESAREEEKIARRRYDEVAKPPTAEEVELKKAELSKKEAQAKKLRDQWKARRVYTSFESLIVEVPKKDEDSVNSGDVVLTLVNQQEAFIIQGMVYENDISKISKGQKAAVKLSGNTAFLSAEVTDISLVAKTIGTARKFPIKLLIQNKIEGPIRLGIGADYEILIEERRGVLALPVQFVVRNADGAGVWILNRGQTTFVPVMLGISDDSFVEIQSGLQEGQKVIMPGGGFQKEIQQP